MTKKFAMLLFIVFFSYLLIGNLFHRVLFPEKTPVISTWFRPGQKLHSKTEGVRQTVLKQEDGYVYCTLEVEPFAAGPPKHIHNDFDETFQIENGVLTIWVNGEITKIHPGEILHVPKGTPHKLYNETADTIRLKGFVTFPEKFAFYLVQVYGVMDNQPGFEHSLEVLFQMPLFQNSGFDSYISEGPPVFIQKMLGFIIAPLSRLIGYKSYYKKYDPFVIDQQ